MLTFCYARWAYIYLLKRSNSGNSFESTLYNFAHHKPNNQKLVLPFTTKLTYIWLFTTSHFDVLILILFVIFGIFMWYIYILKQCLTALCALFRYNTFMIGIIKMFIYPFFYLIYLCSNHE